MAPIDERVFIALKQNLSCHRFKVNCELETWWHAGSREHGLMLIGNRITCPEVVCLNSGDNVWKSCRLPVQLNLYCLITGENKEETISAL